MNKKNQIININFAPPTGSISHKCNAYRDGDWIIFRCSICKDYERRLNWRTKELKVSGDKTEIYHKGNYFPVEYEEVFKNLN